MMRFDSNRAWKEASGAINANRELLYALAGVFYLLPSLAVALLYPQPAAPAGLTGQAAMDATVKYYGSALPAMVPMLIFQAAGTLALLTLFTDRRRPTVRQAIGRGFAGLIPYLISQLILGVGVGLIGGAILTVAAVTGLAALVALVTVLIAIGLLYAWVRSSLAAPVVAVEEERNPLAALRRSWALTRGNTLRITMFYVLVALAFLAVIGVIMMLVGTLLAVTIGGKTAKIVAAIVSSTLGSTMALYFAAILAAVHRQLAGDRSETLSATFE